MPRTDDASVSDRSSIKGRRGGEKKLIVADRWNLPTSGGCVAIVSRLEKSFPASLPKGFGRENARL
jgi:hypothetical protein